MNQPKHILVIRFSAMGDVAMTVPVLRALTQQYPQVKLTVVTREFFKPFFRDLPNVSVFPADVKNKHKGIFGLYKLAKELQIFQFNAVADLHNVLRSNILKFFFSRHKVIQINKGRKEKKALTSGKFFQPLKTTHQRYVDVFKALGYPMDLSNPIFPKKIPLNQNLKTFISNPKLPIIGIAPFATYKSKMYPLDKMETVISELSKTSNIVLFGGGTYEIQVLNKFEEKFQNTTSVAGKLNLNEELDIISNLNLMLSMDSGNAHIASMLGIKVITIWGVTHPYAGFTPFNQPKSNALLPDKNKYPLIPTSVYGNTYPKSYENIAGSITANQITEKVKSLLLTDFKK